MRSEAKAMTTVTDSIGLASGIVDLAYGAMETVRDSFVQIRNLVLVASQDPAPDFVTPVISAFYEDSEYAKSSVAKLEKQNPPQHIKINKSQKHNYETLT